MSCIGLSILPTEILRDFIFKYLSDVDVYRLGNCGDQRLKEICENFTQVGRLWLQKKISNIEICFDYPYNNI